MKKHHSIRNRLNILILVCLLPLTAMIMYLLVLTNRFSQRYDVIVENITKANNYNIDFKNQMDYLMYIIVANSERANELVDVKEPYEMIEDARETFTNLYEIADSDYAKRRLVSILKSLDTLEVCVKDIEENSLVTGSYDHNMDSLDLNIRVTTDLIQEQIQYYIYYETMSLERLREGIREDVTNTVVFMIVLLAIILIGAILISKRIMSHITKPIDSLCEISRQAGSGHFEVRVQGKKSDSEELVILQDSFNKMVEEIGSLVDDIKIEQMNLRAAELRLLQEQINPHFLYNTLDTIIWLAEAGQKEQVVKMVASLSDFFRTTLSKGQDFITVEEERKHIKSYLEIQQFRYRDILEYEIQVPEELYQYEILKLTLQPLVENALYHGIKNKRGKGKIIIAGELLEKGLQFQIIDNGRGMTPERLEEVKKIISGELSNEKEKSGFGLFNVNQRIKLNYGEAYGLEIQSTYMEGTVFTILIPAIEK